MDQAVGRHMVLVEHRMGLEAFHMVLVGDRTAPAVACRMALAAALHRHLVVAPHRVLVAGHHAAQELVRMDYAGVEVAHHHRVLQDHTALALRAGL